MFVSFASWTRSMVGFQAGRQSTLNISAGTRCLNILPDTRNPIVPFAKFNNSKLGSEEISHNRKGPHIHRRRRTHTHTHTYPRVRWRAILFFHQDWSIYGPTLYCTGADPSILQPHADPRPAIIMFAILVKGERVMDGQMDGFQFMQDEWKWMDEENVDC